MTGEYILGYINGYEDGERGRRAPDHPRRSSYNAGYDCGHEDGVNGEEPNYSRGDLDNFREMEKTRLSFFAI